MTEWHPIPGHPHYEITKTGKVRSVDRTIVRADGRTYRLKGKELKTPVAGTKTESHPGYRTASLGASFKRTVHALMMETFVGPPEGRHVRHLNGDPMDNRLENLAYDETGTQNMRDMVEHGRQWQQQKTHCPREHPLEPPNLVASQLALGWRDCLACKRARDRARYLTEPDMKALSDEEFTKLQIRSRPTAPRR